MRATPSTPRAGACPEGMVPIPAGTFWMGSGADDGHVNERPQHPVTLGAFCIDRTEARVRDYRACLAAGRCVPAGTTVDEPGLQENDRSIGSRRCNWRSDRGGREDHPINCIDWEMARSYCEWRGGRLPTEAEWEYAAGGTDGRPYPWGSEAPSVQRLNGCSEECIAELRARGYNLSTELHWDDGHPDTAPVGSFPAGASPFGVLDMAGNVWEWTADWFATYPSGSQNNPAGPESGSERVTRGGAFHNGHPWRVRARFRGAWPPSVRGDYLGVRCVSGVR